MITLRDFGPRLPARRARDRRQAWRGRLRLRSPDLWRNHAEEVAYRLDDDAPASGPEPIVIVDNDGDSEDAARVEIVRLVEAIAGQAHA